MPSTFRPLMPSAVTTLHFHPVPIAVHFFIVAVIRRTLVVDIVRVIIPVMGCANVDMNFGFGGRCSSPHAKGHRCGSGNSNQGFTKHSEILSKVRVNTDNKSAMAQFAKTHLNAG